MVEVARKIPTNLAVHDDTAIPEIDHLPQDNLVPGSMKLYLASAFGFEGLTDIFAAGYELNGETITAFLSKRSGPKDAEAVAESYRNFLIENGATASKATNKTLEGKVLDFYDTTEIIFTIGPFVVGIHEAENQQSAENLAVDLIDKLSEVAVAAPPPVSPALVVIFVMVVVIILLVLAITIWRKKKNLSRGQSNE